MGSIPSISEAEWLIMKVIWDRNPITANEIVDELSPKTDWSPKTVKTMLNRLLKKAALDFLTKGRVYHYIPLVTEEQCLETATDSFLSRFFDGSLNPMVSYHFKREKLTPEEIRELKEIVSRMED
jgi:BlaI family transcriptional regulator, penicillinase repressor